MRRFRRCPEIALVPGLRAVVAERPPARLLGLALMRRPPEHALLIPRCRSVHTWGMRLPIDVVFLACLPGGVTVLSVHTRVPPRRVVSHRGAGPIAVLELPGGMAARLRLSGWPAAQSTTGATAAGAGRTNTRWPTS